MLALMPCVVNVLTFVPRTHLHHCVRFPLACLLASSSAAFPLGFNHRHYAAPLPVVLQQLQQYAPPPSAPPPVVFVLDAWIIHPRVPRAWARHPRPHMCLVAITVINMDSG
jgi:hypothetical protein